MKTLPLLVLGLSLLFAAGCASTPRTAYHVPPRKVASSSADLLVISAVYGSGTQFADVTARVNALLHQPSVEFFARPEWLKADPTPGWNKALVIVYEYKQQRRLFTTGEGGKVSVEKLLEKPKKPAKPSNKKK